MKERTKKEERSGMIGKTVHKRIEECMSLRSQMRHTTVQYTHDNEEKIKDAMNSFIRDGHPCTLKLWADDSQRARVVIILSNNVARMSGVYLEK